jgi:uncharacterized membrane protein YjjP (DUF1212 family)
LLLLAECLLQSGSPPHEVFERVKDAGVFLQVTSQITVLDNKMVISFEEPDEPALPKVHFVQPAQNLNLHQMQEVNRVFQAILCEELSVKIATDCLKHIRAYPPSYSFVWQLAFAFILGSAVCSVGFAGSPADMVVSGCLMVGIVGVLMVGASSNILFQGVSE